MSDAVLAAITSLAERFGRLEARLERLESGQDALKSELATVKSELAAVKSAQERFQHDLDRLRQGVMERIDRLQSLVGALREDVQASFKASERVDDTAEHALKQVRLLTEQVTIMERQILGLSARVAELETRNGG